MFQKTKNEKEQVTRVQRGLTNVGGLRTVSFNNSHEFNVSATSIIW